MTPTDFAALLDRAYVDMTPWTEQDITATLAQPTTVFLHENAGGLIAQCAADECEILVLATDPAAQRSGVASALVQSLEDLATTRGANRILLDVARQNAAARGFYAAQGFAEIGVRKHYYTLRDGTKDDALLLSRPVPWGQGG